jgi:hypothetical protein
MLESVPALLLSAHREERMEAGTLRVRWVGIRFDHTFTLSDFIGKLHEDVRPYVGEDQPYIVGDGPNLECVFEGDVLVGYGAVGRFVVGCDISMIGKVKCILKSMGFTDTRKVKQWGPDA